MQNDAMYYEFHMKHAPGFRCEEPLAGLFGAAGVPSGGGSPRPFRKGSHSHQCTMDTILTGRDIDQSGNDPHGDFVSSYPGHAGVGAPPRSPRRFRKGSYALKATADTTVLAHDVDKSGSDPHAKLLASYPGHHAGLPAGEKPPRRFRKGDHGLQSTMDSTIWGRDIDGSGSDPHAKLVSTFDSHAGVRSGEKSPRRFRKGDHSMMSTVDTVVFGCDLDGSGENPHSKLVGTFDSHAGVTSGEKPVRPLRKGDHSMKSTVDTVVFGRDLDGSGVDPHGDLVEAYSGYAGVICGGRAAERAKAKANSKAAASVKDQRSEPKDLKAPDSKTFAPPPRGENQRAPSSCCSGDSAKPRWR